MDNIIDTMINVSSKAFQAGANDSEYRKMKVLNPEMRFCQYLVSRVLFKLNQRGKV